MTTSARLPDIHDQAKGRWRAILTRFDVATSSLDGKQHACPVCGGKDRFRFDDKDGRGTWFCNVCGAGNGMTMVMHLTGLGFADAAKQVREFLPNCPVGRVAPARDDAKCREQAGALWRSATAIVGTIAEAYLRSRGCWSTTIASCPDLRFIAALSPARTAPDQYARSLPAMLALVRDAAGNPVNVHRTYLDRGNRAYRAMMPGALPGGAAIRLAPAVDRLVGAAEGIETAIRAGARFGVPTWSLINSGNLAKFVPPPGVDHVDIFGDADAKFGGQAAAFTLAHRLACQRSPIECAVHIPAAIGTDWADEQPGDRRAA